MSARQRHPNISYHLPQSPNSPLLSRRYAAAEDATWHFTGVDSGRSQEVTDRMAILGDGQAVSVPTHLLKLRAESLGVKWHGPMFQGIDPSTITTPDWDGLQPW